MTLSFWESAWQSNYIGQLSYVKAGVVVLLTSSTRNAVVFLFFKVNLWICEKRESEVGYNRGQPVKLYLQLLNVL